MLCDFDLFAERLDAARAWGMAPSLCFDAVVYRDGGDAGEHQLEDSSYCARVRRDCELIVQATHAVARATLLAKRMRAASASRPRRGGARAVPDRRAILAESRAPAPFSCGHPSMDRSGPAARVDVIGRNFLASEVFGDP